MHGQLQGDKRVYMKISKGWEKFYVEYEVLLLDDISYGHKQALKGSWKASWETHKNLGNRQSRAGKWLTIIVITMAWGFG